MIRFDPEGLDGLIEFLRDCPGRLCAAVVPGQVGGDELIERLRAALGHLDIHVADTEESLPALGDLAKQLGHGDAMLIVPLDGRRRFNSEEEAVGFWTRFNYLRESLAFGRLRTCLILNSEGDDRLALIADDLREWITFFRFPEAVVRAVSANEVREASVEYDARPESSEAQLATLRDQLRRARELGVPEGQLIWDFARPLLKALVDSGRVREARRLWDQDLRGGEALELLAVERRLPLMREWIHLARMEGNLSVWLEAARRYLEEATAGAEVGGASQIHEVSIGDDEVGDALVARGDLNLALERYRHGLMIMEGLVSQDPSHTEWRHGLAVSHSKVGDVLGSRGDLEGALMSYRRSLEISEGLSSQDPSHTAWQRDLSVSLDKVGDVLGSRGDLEGALTSYRRSLEIVEGLVSQDPSHTQWQRDLAVSHSKVGDVLGSHGDLEGALASYRRSLEIREGLVSQDPSHAAWQRDLSVSLDKIGDVLGSRGDLEGALMSYRRSLEISEGLVSQDPSHAAWQRDLAVSHNKVGDVLGSRGDFDVALTSYRRSREIMEGLASKDPSQTQWQRDLAMSHAKLGDAMRAFGKLSASVEAYRSALPIFERLAELDPTNAQWRDDVARARARLEETAEEFKSTRREPEQLAEPARAPVEKSQS